ncbi:MAG: SDR family oxidoreductase [Acidobacteriota bacterium]
MVAVTGATGYVGTRLVPRLLDEGYRVRCLVRAPRKLADRSWATHPRVEIVRTDLTSASGLTAQLEGCAAAFYLVHSMQTEGSAYAERDRELARTFATCCGNARVERIVYLAGLGEAGAKLSAHLASRREVERLLRDGGVPVTVFRAAMIIGSGSASFEILRYLSERLPVLITPRWVRTECQPIAIDNVLHYLVRCLGLPDTAGRTLEIGGADIVTYEALIRLVAAERGLRPRYIIPVPVLTPFLSALWIHLVTPVSARMARPLAEGLRNRVVVRDPTAARLMPQHLLTARDAIRKALDAESRADVESVWSAAGPMPGDPDWAGGDVFQDSRQRVIAATPERVFDVLTRLGGRHGWFRYNRLWLLRGWLDRLAGGPGTGRGRRDPVRLSWGEALDFWRVTEIDRGRRLTLHAEMRVPGDAVLDFELTPTTGAEGTPATLLVQTARFRPRGLAGLAYWYAVRPFHGLVFDGLISGIAAAAVRPEPEPPVASTTGGR